MKLPFYIARRYLFSRKQKTVINIISWISLVGIAVSTAALIIVLSVYNGIGLLTQSLFNSFDPPLLVQPAKGKTFRLSPAEYDALTRVPGVQTVSRIVEENAWLTYRQNEAIVALRGVDTLYHRITGLDTLLYEGSYHLSDTTLPTGSAHSSPKLGEVAQRAGGVCPQPASPLSPLAKGESPQGEGVHFLLFGAEVYYGLGIRQTSNLPVAVHIPKRGTTSLGRTLDEAFNTAYALPGGNFYIQQDIDSRYVVADIDFVRDLMDYAPDECTALAISLAPGANVQKVKASVVAVLSLPLLQEGSGEAFTVKDRFEQQPLYFKVFRSERLGIYLILALIVLIATLNLMASISLLVLDKRKDIATLRSLGMLPADVRRIFRVEGVLISLVGIVAGMLIGFLVCFVQQQFGIVKMGDNFVVSAFPVAMRPLDFLLTFLLVSAFSALATLLAVRKTALNQ